jgi:hypothetical protein
MTRRSAAFFALPALLWAALLYPSWAHPRWVPQGFGDLMAYHYPMRHLVVSALESGRLPFWNPSIFGGLPLAANPQSVLFYPASLLGYFLPLPLAFSWDFLLHGLWAALGMFLLARRHGLTSAASAAASALFCLAPFLVYRVTEGIPTLLAGLSWVPWAWLAWGRSAPLLGAVWGLQFLSGHPQFLIANALGMGLWGLVDRARGRLLPRLLAGALVALALAAAQWIPTAQFLGRSVRRSWDPAFATAYSVGLKELATWARPSALGDPLKGDFSDVPSVFFETCGIALGAGGLACAALGLFGGARRGLLLVAAGLFLAAGGHNPVYRWALRATALGFLRTPSRYGLLCLWGLLLAAGGALKRFPKAALGFALLGVAQLALWDARFLSAESVEPYRRVHEGFRDAAGGKPLRVMTAPEFASPNKAALYRAMNINGYEAFYLEGFAPFARDSEGKPAADASRSYLTTLDTPLMRAAGVAYKLEMNGRIVKNPKALPLAHFPAAPSVPVEVLLERPERWVITGSVPASGGALAAAVPFYPGWRARTPAFPVSLRPWAGLFTQFDLPPGPFELRLDFVPSFWAPLCAFMALAWAALLCALARSA